MMKENNDEIRTGDLLSLLEKEYPEAGSRSNLNFWVAQGVIEPISLAPGERRIFSKETPDQLRLSIELKILGEPLNVIIQALKDLREEEKKNGFDFIREQGPAYAYFEKYISGHIDKLWAKVGSQSLTSRVLECVMQLRKIRAYHDEIIKDCTLSSSVVRLFHTSCKEVKNRYGSEVFSYLKEAFKLHYIFPDGGQNADGELLKPSKELEEQIISNRGLFLVIVLSIMGKDFTERLSKIPEIATYFYETFNSLPFDGFIGKPKNMKEIENWLIHEISHNNVRRIDDRKRIVAKS